MAFPAYFDRVVALSSEPGNQAFFGRDVLRGLVEGFEDFRLRRQERWWRPGSRTIGPAVLACSPWVGDEELLHAVGNLKAACVVMTKIGADLRAEAGAPAAQRGATARFPNCRSARAGATPAA
jgi:hypothetical protein